jgi:hypothetical protein
MQKIQLKSKDVVFFEKCCIIIFKDNIFEKLHKNKDVILG